MEQNIAVLKSLNKPVVLIKALHVGPGAVGVPSDQAENLEPVLFICSGSEAMLVSVANIWTETGLCNGAIGTVISPIYASEGDASDGHCQKLWHVNSMNTVVRPFSAKWSQA